MSSSSSTLSPDEFDIDRLLNKAKENLSEQQKEEAGSSDRLAKIRAELQSLPSVTDTLGNEALKQLPVKGSVQIVERRASEGQDNKSEFRKIEDPIKVKQRAKAERESNAGEKWFSMPKTEVTPEIKRDLQLLQMRNVLDRKRHYKKEKGGFPTYFQTGTIIEGNTEFYSARLTNKQRKKTLAEEILAETESRKYFKRKYGEIQSSKTSGRKAHYKKVKEMRKKL